MRVVRLTLLGCGTGLFAYLVSQVGAEALGASFRALSWGVLLPVCFPFALVAWLDTLGWGYAFRRDLAPLSRLVLVRLAGEAFNAITPTGSMGGEPVKAALLRRWVPLAEGVASVIVAKTTIVLAQGIFLVMGIVLALLVLPPTAPILQGMGWLAVVGGAAIGGFIVVQQKGLWLRPLGRLRGLGLPVGAARDSLAGGLDRALSGFYREHRGRFLLSVGFHLAGWVAGALEVYLILHLMGRPVSAVDAFVIEAFTTSIRSAAFLVPAGIGAVEGGHVAVFAALGLDGGLGLGVTMVRRLRELAWVALGLGALALLRERQEGG